MAHWLLLLLAALPALGQDPLKPQNVLPGCPDIVSRSEWGALSSQCVRPLNLPVDYVLVSQTAGSPCFAPTECEQQMRSLQTNHVQTRGWCDIAYNFLIGEDGLIYEGRGWSTLAAQSSPNVNPISLGIGFIGNFMNRSPAPRALRAMQSLLRCGAMHGVLSAQYTIRRQQDGQGQAFPEERLFTELRKLHRFQG